jgi:hypothetical protein
MNTDESKVVMRAAALVGGGLVLGGLALAIGIYLAADRLAGRLEIGVTNHGAMVRDAGARVAEGLEKTSAAVQNHGDAVAKAGERIAKAEIRVVDPLPIQQPVTVKGVAADGAMPVNAKVGK